ncbi:unnamed protein product [Miscanthus lutarioriparius]|uniref:Uncharacterized protein n=1 Tax=Miscanthus lutarioriparius TaxID=422564 RepID=A0A811R0T7_9POAL|nr:unnamed protein product [Miscanthus lutarioriparius]
MAAPCLLVLFCFLAGGGRASPATDELRRVSSCAVAAGTEERTRIYGEVAFGHGDVVVGRGHGGAAVLACSEPRGRTGWGAAVLGFSRAQSRRREHEGTAQQQHHILSEICSLKLSFLFSLSDLNWMASRGLSDGGQR